MMYFVGAHDRNFGIGNNATSLPWPLMPADKARLHELTEGKHIVLGERTYHCYKNIQKDFQTKEVTVISATTSSLPDALVVDSLDKIILQSKTEDLWVIGGGSIFQQLLPFVECMYLTRIEGEFEADVFFPKYSLEDWHVVEETYEADQENPYPYTFLKLTRKLN